MLITVTTAPVVAEARLPTAAFVASPPFGVVGSVVKLDGRLSSDPDKLPLTYSWRFVSVPIGSQVKGEGFRTLDRDSISSSASFVSFSPDVVGEYVVGLKVANDVFESEEVTNTVSIRAILVPHGRGIIPDGKFIWSYIRDVWTQVEGKEFFETLWSALIQIAGSELLKLYQVDFNKSIRDIQDRFQRRWLAYEPKLSLTQSDLSFYIGNHFAGNDASTINLGLEGQAIILAPDEVVVVLGARLQSVAGETLSILYSGDPANVGDYELAGVNSTRTGYRLASPELNPTQDIIAADFTWVFELGSTTWMIEGTVPNNLAESLSEWAPLSDTLLPLFNQNTSGGINDMKKGDVIHYPSGPNAGFYRIVEKSGSYVVVDHAPPSFSDSTTSVAFKSDVYRPVGFKVTQPAASRTNTFWIPYTPGKNDISVIAPGRIVSVGGQAFRVVRAAIDRNQVIPAIVVTVDSEEIPAGLRGLGWRVPHTLISSSQNFDELGVTTGDLIAFDIVMTGVEATSEIVGQVVGVSGNAVGFVLTNEEVPLGQVPPIPDETYLRLASDFAIDGLFVGTDGELVFSGTALEYVNSVNSGAFKRKYWNTELTPSSDIQVNPTFRIKPRYIIRNRTIPVDDTLRSVPTLQEWVNQPVLTERDGKLFQVSPGGKEYELKNRPTVLTENLEYLIDDEFAFIGRLTINTGSQDIEADDADFLDRGMKVGDSFIINSPLTLQGTYLIEAVLSNTHIRLTRPVPAYVLGEFVTAEVTLERKKTGRFLRFVPGLFTALKPAPPRFWAEASLFDNSQAIEDNFGILVGLTKDTLESVSRDITYRQAVSGLMFAFTRGSSIEKIRLGAQILLGLPFAENRGIVRSIEEDYRLDVAGNPILGRILIEDVDSAGAPLGTLRIYIYPIDSASALAGLEVNPATGQTYQVGDFVELFAPLSKGVEIYDYVSNPDASVSSIAQLKKYHSVALRANDNIFSLEELSLVSDFLKKITPSYVSYSLINASEFADRVNIADILFNGLRLGGGGNDGEGNGVLVDNASLNIPAALMLDSKSADGVPQITWNDELNFLYGVLSVRRFGTDLVTTDNSASVTSAAGGFINPKAHEEFEPPLTRVLDLFAIFSGPNQGVYPVGGVTSDTELFLANAGTNFHAASGQSFAVFRRATALLSAGTANVVSGNASVVVNAGFQTQLRNVGVAPGDWLVLGNASSSKRHIIRSVQEQTLGSGVWNKLDVTPTPTFTNATSVYQIYRPSLLWTSETFTVSATSQSPGSVLDVSANPHLQGLLSIGDELIIDEPARRRLTVVDPETMFVVPQIFSGDYTVSVAFKNRPNGGPIGWDHIEKFDPIDEADIAIWETQPQANCTNNFDTVTLSYERTTAPADPGGVFNPQAHNIMLGDFLVLIGGTNGARDVGFGPGYYPIVQVTSTNVRLSTTLTGPETLPWKIVRRR